MMTKVNLIIIIAMACLVTACKQDDLPDYKGPRSVVMAKTWLDDASGYSYSYINQGVLTEDSVSLGLVVKLLGSDLADSVLVVPYTLVFEASDLTPAGFYGESYQLDGFLSGKKLTDTIFIKLFRDSTFMDTIYTMKVSLNTAAVYNTYIETAEQLGLFRTLAIRIHDQFEEPEWWKNYVGYLGIFSSKKMRTLCIMDGWEATEYFRMDYWFNVYMSEDPFTLGSALRQFLEEKERTGDPIRERDGSPMRAGVLVYD